MATTKKKTKARVLRGDGPWAWVVLVGSFVNIIDSRLVYSPDDLVFESHGEFYEKWGLHAEEVCYGAFKRFTGMTLRRKQPVKVQLSFRIEPLKPAPVSTRRKGRV